MEITLNRLLYRDGYYNRALFENNHNKSLRIGSCLDRFQNAVTRELHVSHDASMSAYLTNLLRTKNTSAPSHRSFIFYIFFFLRRVIFRYVSAARVTISWRIDAPRDDSEMRAAPTLFRNLTRGEDARFNSSRGYKMCNLSRICNHFLRLSSFRTASNS